MRALWRTFGTLAAAAASDPALAQDDDAQSGESVTLEARYVAEGWTVLGGGLEQDEAFLHMVDLAAEVDLDAAMGWNGATARVQAIYNNAESISEPVGDAQVISNIETGIEALRLYEAWIEQEIGDTASVRLGLYDLNSEFDVLEPAGLFVNSAFGIGTDIGLTGENGPSIFPVTSLAARVQWQASDELIVRTAVLDGVPGNLDRPTRTSISLSEEDGVLMIAELDYSLGDSRVLAGVWNYTADFERIDGSTGSGNAGVYLRAETLLAGGGAAGSPALHGFARLGLAEGGINTFSRFVSAGLTLSGPWGEAEDAQIGLAFATALTSDTFRVLNGAARQETAIEATYRHQILPWLAVQPSLQHIVNPGANAGTPDATVIGLRLEFTN